MKRRLVRFLLVLGSSLVVGYAGYALGAKNQPHDSNNQPLRESSQAYTYIRPLLVCDNLTDDASRQYDALRNTIADYIDEQKTNGALTDAGIYFRDLSNGAWTGIDPDLKFDPASLLKVPLMIAAYRQADLGSDLLTRQIDVPEDLPQKIQTIVPTQSIKNGSTYTVDELVRYMIQYSDNRAKDLLYPELDQQVLSAVLLDLGITDLNNPDGSSSISPKNYSLFFRILYNGSYLSRDLSERALSYLAAADFNDALVAGLPLYTVVAHKFGDFSDNKNNARELHDCGIIYTTNKNYALCVMTRGQSQDHLKNVIAEISQLVYEQIF